MGRVRLIHWKEGEAAARLARLREAGYDVDYEPFSADLFRRIRRDPPDALVIDLGRLPSHGRDVALAMRESKATRNVPLVMVEGDPAKVERIRAALPDAVYTGWSRIRGALRRAISRPPRRPQVPSSRLAGYSGTPLPRKLGIKPDYVVALIGAPEGFDRTLGELPAGVKLRRRARGRCDLVVWFARSAAELERRVERLGALAGAGGLWICWRKRASGVSTDLTQALVRRTGLAAGLVDYKICSVDPVWSGLRFAVRRR